MVALGQGGGGCGVGSGGTEEEGGVVALVAMRRAGKQGRGGGLGGVVGVNEEGVAVWRRRAWR